MCSNPTGWSPFISRGPFFYRSHAHALNTSSKAHRLRNILLRLARQTVYLERKGKSFDYLLGMHYIVKCHVHSPH